MPSPADVLTRMLHAAGSGEGILGRKSTPVEKRSAGRDLLAAEAVSGRETCGGWGLLAA